MTELSHSWVESDTKPHSPASPWSQVCNRPKKPEISVQMLDKYMLTCRRTKSSHDTRTFTCRQKSMHLQMPEKSHSHVTKRVHMPLKSRRGSCAISKCSHETRHRFHRIREASLHMPWKLGWTCSRMRAHMPTKYMFACPCKITMHMPLKYIFTSPRNKCSQVQEMGATYPLTYVFTCFSLPNTYLMELTHPG